MPQFPFKDIALKNSPPVFGGVEARKSFSCSKGPVQVQEVRDSPGTTTPPKGQTASRSPPYPQTMSHIILAGHTG
jgi:hypothetical protein